MVKYDFDSRIVVSVKGFTSKNIFECAGAGKLFKKIIFTVTQKTMIKY